MPVLSVQMKGELERVSKFRRHVVGRTVGIQNTHIPKGQVEVAVDIQDERSVHPLVAASSSSLENPVFLNSNRRAISM